uniref:Uncharacterized protein n=1 Tax=Oryza sativa subsp. japonica TaxID=39947 RepID=Q6ZI64_ORYSJ|nr:hypothetical protein [Oryza sativa Japonica Group]
MTEVWIQTLDLNTATFPFGIPPVEFQRSLRLNDLRCSGQSRHEEEEETDAAKQPRDATRSLVPAPAPQFHTPPRTNPRRTRAPAASQPKPTKRTNQHESTRFIRSGMGNPSPAHAKLPMRRPCRPWSVMAGTGSAATQPPAMISSKSEKKENPCSDEA